MADKTESWAEQTLEVPPQPEAFQPGRAPVNRRPARTETFPVAPHQPAGWPGGQRPRPPVGFQLRQLRRGAGWTKFGGLVAFVCWGIWAISARGNLATPVITFVLTLFVALGLFTLTRMVGRVVWERQLGRVRRSARGAHLLTGLFLVGVGTAYLRQTEWVVSAWNWLARQW
jgi:hypothetical protein